jgi:arginine/lysine/ornithine decarboxylase
VSGRPAPSASGDEQRVTPVLDGLLLYRERDYAPFHMPGHKRGAGSPPRLREALGAALDVDLPLTPGFEDTRQRTGYLGVAEDLAAAAWGADRAYFLTNGSSGGLHTLALAFVS